MKKELLIQAVTEDTSGILLDVSKAAYSLEPIPKLEAIDIARKTNNTLGYDLFDDLYYPRLVLDFSRVARVVQVNAYEENIHNLYERVEHLLQNEKNEQDKLYEQIVVPSLGLDNFEEAYNQYQTSLGHFDARAFERTLKSILEFKDTELNRFADSFLSIAEYSNARNNWDDKIQEILDSDASMDAKQSAIDSLDFARSKAHNKLIHLVNTMNEFAESNGIVQPYPNNGHTFDPTKPQDREIVASIMSKHMPVMDVVNHYVQELNISVESDYEKQRTMTITELARYVLDQQGRDFADGIKALTSQDNMRM